MLFEIGIFNIPRKTLASDGHKVNIRYIKLRDLLGIFNILRKTLAYDGHKVNIRYWSQG